MKWHTELLADSVKIPSGQSCLVTKQLGEPARLDQLRGRAIMLAPVHVTFIRGSHTSRRRGRRASQLRAAAMLVGWQGFPSNGVMIEHFVVGMNSQILIPVPFSVVTESNDPSTFLVPVVIASGQWIAVTLRNHSDRPVVIALSANLATLTSTAPRKSTGALP